ncbi:hypothetical protein RHSIM_Rhsim10G0176500 [Rhododendron simsii]|uniref:RNase H type-1 domain-containing protein n=1 Tax=Rhododendron simsii TaxID=118357 RepID=A0A834GD11_RHOSS|nr:hypothetical protein RHSIM_Rhsim10G0176500 [Rhododendron simsii]
MQDEANALTLAETEARIAATEAHMEWIQQPADARRTRFTLGQKRPAHEWNLFSGDAWWMTVDGASNIHGAGAGVVLVSPEGTVHEHVVSIGYRATNNEAEYEALIAGLQVALRLGADSVHVFCDSRLIVGHLNDDYQAKDERMNANRTLDVDESTQSAVVEDTFLAIVTANDMGVAPKSLQCCFGRNSILLKGACKIIDTGTLSGVKYHGGIDLNLRKYVEIQFENLSKRENDDFDVLEDGEIAN